MGPAGAAAASETTDLPPGRGERFAGYGVMGLPFRSGHVLAMRRFPASSIGPAYTSVWHRTPAGLWTFWQDQPPEQSCPRYFSVVVDETRRVHIDIAWPTDTTLNVTIPEVGLSWTSHLVSTPITRTMNVVGSVLPGRAWRSRRLLAAMGRVAGRAMGAGQVALWGQAPNGQSFMANPLRMWVIDKSTASLGEDNFGPVGALDEQAHLGDFWIPQRGVFTIGRVSFDTT